MEYVEIIEMMTLITDDIPDVVFKQWYQIYVYPPNDWLPTIPLYQEDKHQKWFVSTK